MSRITSHLTQLTLCSHHFTTKVLISPGVARSFYSRFATFVAQETGWPVLTYNFRGNEGVLPEAKRKELPQHPLVDVSADFSDWALLDQPAALSYLLAHLRNALVEEDCAVSGGGKYGNAGKVRLSARAYDRWACKGM